MYLGGKTRFLRCGNPRQIGREPLCSTWKELKLSPEYKRCFEGNEFCS